MSDEQAKGLVREALRDQTQEPTRMDFSTAQGSDEIAEPITHDSSLITHHSSLITRHSGLRVAIVHDWLNQYGGAERVLETLRRLYPTAPIYTSMYEPAAMPAEYRQWPIRTSFMQRLPAVTKRHQMYLPVYPVAFETFDLSGYDLVISNSSGFCHGVITRPETCHINYCLTPPRYVWNLDQYVQREQIGGPMRRLLPLLMSGLRIWDRVAAQRADHVVGISKAIVRRIRKYYRREAGLIYPPVRVGSIPEVGPPDDYCLVASRLIPYKRVDRAVAAFNQLGLRLVVVGDGRDRPALERMARPNVQFLGRVPEQRLRELIAGCRAFIFPGEEDFGIAPLEAQAAGRPVIAYAAGGALETVIEGVTGEFFREPTVESLVEAVERFCGRQYYPEAARRNALAYSEEVFLDRLRRFVDERLAEHGGRVMSEA